MKVDERALRSSVGAFPEAIAAAGLGSPAVIVIGRVVDLAKILPEAATTAPYGFRMRRN